MSRSTYSSLLFIWGEGVDLLAPLTRWSSVYNSCARPPSILTSTLGYSNFNNSMGLPSKKFPNNILKFFSLHILSHFLQICILRFSKHTLFVLNDSKIFNYFLQMSIQKTQILRWFQIRWYTWKQKHPKKIGGRKL